MGRIYKIKDKSNVEKLTKDNGCIDLKAYVKLIVKNYKQEIIDARRKLGFKSKQIRLFGSDFSISKDDVPKKFQDILKHRSKYMWYGIIYKITQILPGGIEGKSIGGMSETTMDIRWIKYIEKAIETRGSAGELHKLIYDTLISFGLEEGAFTNPKTGNLMMKKILDILDSRFRRDVEQIHFSDNSLRLGEANFIDDNNLINNGLNQIPGGSGGSAIDLPMMRVAFYIALGYNPKEITDILNNKYGIKCGQKTVQRRINDFFNSLNETRIKFMKPVLETLVKARFELYEINNAYNAFMNKFLKAFFGGKSYLELVEIIDQDWSNLHSASNIPKLIKKKFTSYIPGHILKELVFRHLGPISASKQENIQKYLNNIKKNSKKNILNRQIEAQLGYNNWQDARKGIAIPYLIKGLRGTIPPKQLYITAGYNSLTVKNHNKISSNLFFGMTTSQVQKFLRKSPSIATYKEFKEVFLSKNNRNGKTLTKGMLDELIRKNNFLTTAANHSDFILKEITTLINEYYSTWENAIIQVKIPYIFDSLRKNIDGKKIYLEVGYSSSSAALHNQRSQVLFEMRTENVRSVVKKYLWISTLEDFQKIINKSHLRNKN